jgi:DMSO/TMAO reductase YedYZ heme-binding membrane subunit
MLRHSIAIVGIATAATCLTHGNMDPIAFIWFAWGIVVLILLVALLIASDQFEEPEDIRRAMAHIWHSIQHVVAKTWRRFR